MGNRQNGSSYSSSVKKTSLKQHQDKRREKTITRRPPFAISKRVTFRLKLNRRFKYPTDFQKAIAVVTNRPEIFWRDEEGRPHRDARVLLLQQIKSVCLCRGPKHRRSGKNNFLRKCSVMIYVVTTLGYGVELYLRDECSAREFLSCICRQKEESPGRSALICVRHGSRVDISATAILGSYMSPPLKEAYHRPYFMGSNYIGSSGNERPILTPPRDSGYDDIFGYAECRKGVSQRNDDSSIYVSGTLICGTPYEMYCIFDGHGRLGWHVSCFAQKHFHRIFEEVMARQFSEILPEKDFLRRQQSNDADMNVGESSFANSSTTGRSTRTSLVVTPQRVSEEMTAILRESIVRLDLCLRRAQQLWREKKKKTLFMNQSGATALVVVKTARRLWVCSAGDLVAVACGRSDSLRKLIAKNQALTSSRLSLNEMRRSSYQAVLLNERHTVLNERQRLQWTAHMRPDLLGRTFSRRLFEYPSATKDRRGFWCPSIEDVGRRALHWDFHLSGAPMPTSITTEDVARGTRDGTFGDLQMPKSRKRVRIPMISRSGESMKLFGRLKSARGVGDFDTSSRTGLLVKPFVSSVADVRSFDLDFTRDDSTETRALTLVLASSGVCDALSTNDLADVLLETLEAAHFQSPRADRDDDARGRIRRVSEKAIEAAARSAKSRERLTRSVGISVGDGSMRPRSFRRVASPFTLPPHKSSARDETTAELIRSRGLYVATASKIVSRAVKSNESSRSSQKGVGDATVFVVPLLDHAHSRTVTQQVETDDNADTIVSLVRKVVRLSRELGVSLEGDLVSVESDTVYATAKHAELVESARTLFDTFDYVIEPFTKTELESVPISLPGLAPQVVTGDVESLEHISTCLCVLRVSSNEFHVWKDASSYVRIKTFDSETLKVCERLGDLGHYVDARRDRDVTSSDSAKLRRGESDFPGSSRSGVSNLGERRRKLWGVAAASADAGGIAAPSTDAEAKSPWESRFVPIGDEAMQRAPSL